MFDPMPADILQAERHPSELTSWDFLQDAELGLGPELVGSSQLLLPANSTLSSAERLKEKNRKAQKRFRERKKERAQTTEMQLAEATSQLHDLRLKQRELEARNSLLEKIAALNKQQTFSDSSRGSARTQDDSISTRQADERYFFLQVLEQAGLKRAQQKSAIVLTGRDCEEEVTIDYLANLPRDELLQLKMMAQCVLDISDNTQSKPLVDLQRYSLEMAAAFVCFWMTTAHRAAAAVIESLSVDPCGQGALPDSQYEDLLVAMKHTEAQEQDLLHLRRLFYGKLGQLSRKRAALLKKMPSPVQPNKAATFHCGFRHVAEQVSLAEEVSEVSDQLCDNHAEESSVYRMHAFCMFRCIYSSVQHATMMVHSYPRPVDPNKLLDYIASKHNEPSIEVLLSPSEVDDLQHSANWETVKKYISTLSPSNVHEHCPFLPQNGNSQS